jgi:hypothetical protein
VGVQSQQRLLQESIFYQHLFDAYTSLGTAVTVMQQIHTDLQGTATYATQPHPSMEILRDNQVAVRGLAVRFNTILATYLKQDLIAHSPDLMALFTEAGHAAQINEQQTYSGEVQASWQSYHTLQEQVLSLINTGSFTRAQTVVLTQESTALADVIRNLHELITFSIRTPGSL